MEDLIKKFQKKRNCQACSNLTISLKQYSGDRARKNNEIYQKQNTLYQLKEDVRDLKIENMSTDKSLKPRAIMWKHPTFCFTSVEDMNTFPPESQSISSRLPLVRPRKIKYPSIMENYETKEVDVKSSFVASEDSNEYEIPQAQPGCEVCKSLQEQIRKEIVELRMLERKSLEKEKEISEYQRQEAELKNDNLKSQKQISQMSITPNTFRKEFSRSISQYSNSSDSFPPKSSSGTIDDAESFEFSEYLLNEGGLEDNSMLSRFSFLFEEYQNNKVDMKALQTRQDSIVELLHSMVVLSYNCDSDGLPINP